MRMTPDKMRKHLRPGGVSGDHFGYGWRTRHAPRVVVVRVRNQQACVFRSWGFLDKRHVRSMFWCSLPAPVTGREPYRVLPLNADGWIVKKEFFDAKDPALKLNGMVPNTKDRDVREGGY